jgi:hypothetical protein
VHTEEIKNPGLWFVLESFRTNMLTLILFVFAFVLFVLAGLGVPSSPRFNFIGWGLACVALAVLLERSVPLLR